MCSSKSITKPEQLARLWCHESKRVFEDRLINREDHAWFKQLLQQRVTDNFQMVWENVVPQVRWKHDDASREQHGSLGHDQSARRYGLNIQS